MNIANTFLHDHRAATGIEYGMADPPISITIIAIRRSESRH